MQRKTLSKLLYALVAVSFAGLADTVIVNGVGWECQHICNVIVSPNGGTSVIDSQHGWVKRLSQMQ